MQKNDAAAHEPDLFDLSTAKEVSFGDVARNLTETVKDPQQFGVQHYVGLEHLQPNSLRLRKWGDVAEGTTFTRKFSAGNVLFAKRRPYQRKVVLSPIAGVCSGDILVFEAQTEKLTPGLLPYLVQSHPFIDHAVRTSAGSLSPRTKWSELRKFRFVLPDLLRQEQIASLFSGLDAAIWAKEDVLNAVEISRQSLVEREVERPGFQEAVVVLNDLVEEGSPICYGILKPGPHTPGGVSVIKVKDYPAGVIDASDLLLTSAKIDAEYRRSKLAEGDLLLSIRGTVGRLAEVPSTLADSNITQDTARIRLRADVSRTYVRALMESSPIQRQMRERTVGLAVQGLNIRDVRTLKIPFPALQEQKRFLARLAVVTQAEERVRLELVELRRLKDRLLARLVLTTPPSNVH
jgi:type I restriction enzyme, S subunit